MIHVENVYEEILHQSLLDETLKGEEDLLGAEGTSGTGDPVRPARFLNRMEGEEEMATGLLGRQRRKEREERGLPALMESPNLAHTVVAQ